MSGSSTRREIVSTSAIPGIVYTPSSVVKAGMAKQTAHCTQPGNLVYSNVLLILHFSGGARKQQPKGASVTFSCEESAVKHHIRCYKPSNI
jgi:hypothetical protein